MGNKNLELWNKWEKTPKDIVQEAELEDGTKIKTVSSIHRIKRATEILGIYGKDWGLKNIVFTKNTIFNNLILAEIEATFYVHNGEYDIEFQISNSTDIVSVKDKIFTVNKMYRKSLETDTINKALSRLGLFADIYADEELISTGDNISSEFEEIDFVEIGVENEN